MSDDELVGGWLCIVRDPEAFSCAAGGERGERRVGAVSRPLWGGAGMGGDGCGHAVSHMLWDSHVRLCGLAALFCRDCEGFFVVAG